MSKTNVVYPYNETSLSLKKEGNVSHATARSLKIIMLSEVSQAQKDRP